MANALYEGFKKAITVHLVDVFENPRTAVCGADDPPHVRDSVEWVQPVGGNLRCDACLETEFSQKLWRIADERAGLRALKTDAPETWRPANTSCVFNRALAPDEGVRSEAGMYGAQRPTPMSFAGLSDWQVAGVCVYPAVRTATGRELDEIGAVLGVVRIAPCTDGAFRAAILDAVGAHESYRIADRSGNERHLTVRVSAAPSSTQEVKSRVRAEVERCLPARPARLAWGCTATRECADCGQVCDNYRRPDGSVARVWVRNGVKNTRPFPCSSKPR